MSFPRSAGILLHPTSLPGPNGIGELGPDAFRFADTLAAAGMKLWQMLPLGPTGYGDSPYQCLTAFAGNPLLIHLPDDGTPFPTTYYLTHPGAVSALSTLEADGAMRDMNARLDNDDALGFRYRVAHESYLADRAEMGEVDEIAGVSAGGMPERVKCLHALAAHALAVGPGVNPFGDEALEAIRDAWRQERCTCPSPRAF